MLKKLSLPALLMLGTAFTHISADEMPQDSVSAKKWEVGVMANGFIEGSDNDGLQSSGAGGLRTMYRFKPNWTVVGEYMFTSKASVRNSDDKFDIHRMLATVDWDAFPEKKWTPYIALGAGYESLPDDAAERNGVVAVYGLGIRVTLNNFFGLNNDYLGLNAEAKRKDNLDHRDVNVLLTVGLNYRFSTDEK